MIIFEDKLQAYISTIINDDDITSGFGTNKLGDGRWTPTIVAETLRIGKPNCKIVRLGQIHSINIAYLDKISDEHILKIEETDGLISSLPNILLTSLTADCLPLILADKKNGLVGISHQGWRGSLKNMAGKMIGKMVEYGANKQMIKVAIGPSIGQCCYDVDDDRYYSYLEELDEYADQVFIYRHGKQHLNLLKLNYLQLISSGLKHENIDYFPFCTVCNKQKFFSYRRDRKKNTGDMLNFVIRHE